MKLIKIITAILITQMSTSNSMFLSENMRRRIIPRMCCRPRIYIPLTRTQAYRNLRPIIKSGAAKRRK